MIWKAYAVTVLTEPKWRYWSGSGSLDHDGNTYVGAGNLLGFSGFQLLRGTPDRRASISLSGINPVIKQRLLVDAGPLETEVQYIFSADYGRTWQNAPVMFKGRFSTPRHDDGTVVIELETRKGDAERGRPRRNSHADQQRRHPGDRCFEYMAQLSQPGFDAAFPN